MSDKTHIQWTAGDDGTEGATWNPLTGCTRISDGCDHCYIERTPPFRINHRTFDKPGIGGRTGVLLHPERLDQPLRWRRPRRVFVNSLSDLFHESTPTEYIVQIFATMALTSRHTYQVLTKRHGRMRSLLNSPEFWRQVGHTARHMGYSHVGATRCLADGRDIYDTSVWGPLRCLPNVWLGVSVESQEWACLRVDALLATPAAVRWISAEPLLNVLDLGPWFDGVCVCDGDGEGCECVDPTRNRIDWVVVGGESGPGARRMDEGWARWLVKQCQDAEVPVFVKQMGSVWAKLTGASDLKGGNPAEWPEVLRIREFPHVAEAVSVDA